MKKMEEQKNEEQNEPVGSPLEEGRKLVDELRAENEKTEALLERQEAIAAAEMLSGKSTVEQPEEKKEMTPKEYADKVMNGEIKPQ